MVKTNEHVFSIFTNWKRESVERKLFHKKNNSMYSTDRGIFKGIFNINKEILKLISSF